MKNKPNIKVVSASVKGLAHAHKKQPCQDVHAYSCGKNFVATVADGAGSAKYGKIGAKTICHCVNIALKNSDINNVKKNVIKAIENAHDILSCHRLNKTKNTLGLADFAATLVGLVYSQSGGFFFHIGDGAAITFKDGNYEKYIASLPQNGAFSCETFFFTQTNWRENLRFTKFKNTNTFLLMSDGISCFAFKPEFKKLEESFIMPIDNFLNKENNHSKALRALENTLNSEKAQKINSDDKTLLWAKVKYGK